MSEEIKKTVGRPPTRGETHKMTLVMPKEYKPLIDELAWRNRTNVTGFINDLLKERIKQEPDLKEKLER